jgi:hypothetical protein
VDDTADEKSNIELDVFGCEAGLFEVEDIAGEVYGGRRAVTAALLVPDKTLEISNLPRERGTCRILTTNLVVQCTFPLGRRNQKDNLVGSRDRKALIRHRIASYTVLDRYT